MFCFEILRIFREKSRKSKIWKSGHFGLLRRSVGCLAAARLRCQNGTPRVRHGLPTVHREQISDFCFRKPRICTPIV